MAGSDVADVVGDHDAGLDDVPAIGDRQRVLDLRAEVSRALLDVEAALDGQVERLGPVVTVARRTLLCTRTEATAGECPPDRAAVDAVVGDRVGGEDRVAGGDEAGFARLELEAVDDELHRDVVAAVAACEFGCIEAVHVDEGPGHVPEHRCPDRTACVRILVLHPDQVAIRPGVDGEVGRVRNAVAQPAVTGWLTQCPRRDTATIGAGVARLDRHHHRHVVAPPLAARAPRSTGTSARDGPPVSRVDRPCAYS